MDSKVLFEDDVNEIREYLSVHPEDININILSYNDTTPLMNAVVTERMDVIDCLIEHGCDINFQTNGGLTALHNACGYKNNRDIIERLITNGATGLLKDKFGNTVLHYAAFAVRDVNIIHQLLFVSDPNSLNNEGKNPLMRIHPLNANIQIVSALINVTHNINLQDFNGNTVLHSCCSCDRKYNLTKLLLSCGADPFIENNRGTTPYMLAYREGKRIIDEYLCSQK